MRPLFAALAVVAFALAGTALPAMPATASSGAAPDSLGLDLARLAGPDRFATSVAVSRASSAPGDVVFLASGITFPDALAAGPVAAAEGAHLLLARTDSIDAVVLDRIRELAPREIVLVGARPSLGAAVEVQLADALPGTALTRIGGRDRVETSTLLHERLRSHVVVEEVWVVSGHDFPDALVAASVAGATRSAIVLDHHGSDEASTRAWYERVAPIVQGARVSIAGGTPSVSSDDEAWLRQVAARVERFAGADRYETAQIVNEARRIEGGSGRMLVATGQKFPDALSGAVLAASEHQPLWLSPRACDPSVTPALGAAAAVRGVTTVVGLGSRASIVDDALALADCPTYSPTQELLGRRYGTVETERYSGTGDARIRISTATVGYVFVQLEHLSDGPSEVVAYDSFDQPRERLFSGEGTMTQTAVALAGRQETWDSIGIDVRAQGPWRLVVSDLRLLPDLPPRVRADAQRVYGYNGPTAPCSFTSPMDDPHGEGRVRQTAFYEYQHVTYDVAVVSRWNPAPRCTVTDKLSWLTIRSDSPWEFSVG